ncbi:MAG: bifunctional riboflavin kinase/FAD synthetase [Candidatus Omnitrophica bacterium]|nr:bifunctional riboflavin kinase/FAD synthetase [Candidatus Omnitrophota bacterium]MCF7893580.1 bifunctional riboflavin kinase/FAD synthetase [Candidatus Omnitrophota bacterium]
MKLIYKNLPSHKVDNCIVTIGAFDGVHLGHQHILKEVKSQAKKNHKPSLVISFDTPPKKVLYSKQKFKGYLTDYRQKASLIESLGVDYLWILETKTNLLNYTADKFLSYISNYFSIDEMIVGSDFRFGIKAGAGTTRLSQLSDDYNFRLKIINKKKFDKTLVSSSFIRELIRSSKLEKSKKLLGRNYTLKAKVVRGKGVGRQLGFPTANLNTFDYILPGQGVYAAYSKVENKDFLAAVNIGKKDFEVHLLNFSKDILNSNIEVTLLSKIRDELSFQSRGQLIKQIQKDIQNITSKYSTPTN